MSVTRSCVVDYSTENLFTWCENIVETVSIVDKMNGANYSARSIKCHAFGWNAPHNRGVLARSDVFL